MANKQGYVITISATDQASAQLDKVNKRMTALGNTSDKFNKSQTEQNTLANKRGKDLNKNILDFGRYSKSELSAINKLFEKTTKNVTNTVSALGSAFKLGGLVTGIGLMTGGTVAFGKALAGAANHAYNLNTQAQLLGTNTNRLQRFFGVANLATNGNVSSNQLFGDVSGMRTALMNIQNNYQGADQNLKNWLLKNNINIANKDGSIKDPTQLIQQIIPAILKQSSDPSKQRQILEALHLGDLSSAIIGGKWGQATKDYEKYGTSENKATIQHLGELSHSFTVAETAIEGLGNTIYNDLDKSGWLKTINDGMTKFDNNLVGLNKWFEAHPKLTADVTVGGAATAGYLGLRTMGKGALAMLRWAAPGIADAIGGIGVAVESVLAPLTAGIAAYFGEAWNIKHDPDQPGWSAYVKSHSGASKGNNNPGNIRDGKGGFKSYATEAEGEQGIIANIKAYHHSATKIRGATSVSPSGIYGLY